MRISEDRSSADWLDRKEYPFEPHYVQVDGGQMHYVDEGQGEAILFVHGFPTWSFMWRGLIRDLSIKHRCIAMDHIGFGLSEKPEHWSYTPEAHARNYRKLLDHLGLSKFSLVVHDLGGPIAFAHAVDFPGRINKICVLNSCMWSLKNDEHFVKFDHKVNGPLGRMTMTSTSMGLNNLLKGMIEQKQKVASTVYSQYSGPFQKASDRLGPFGLAKGYIGSSDWLYDMWTKHDELKNVPLQVLWGIKDKLFAPTQLDKWRAHFPNADITTFPESGHMVVEEQAREVEAEMYMFMDGAAELQRVGEAIHSDF
jgi:pimeloyl-ACP methyl ester carboxylesterase